MFPEGPKYLCGEHLPRIIIVIPIIESLLSTISRYSGPFGVSGGVDLEFVLKF